MAKRKCRTETEGTGEEAAAVQTEADVKFAEALGQLTMLTTIKQRIARKIETFKRRGNINAANIRRFIAELVEALD